MCPVIKNKIGFGIKDRLEAKLSPKKWFLYNKGGSFRKWYGNNEFVVDYYNDGEELKSVVKEKYRDREYAKNFSDERWDKLIEIWVLKNQQFYFLPSVTWTFVSSAHFGARYSGPGFIFDVGGSSIFPQKDDIFFYTGYLCSKLASNLLQLLNPTLNFQVENISSLPILENENKDIYLRISQLSEMLIENSTIDWDNYETSWDFREFLLCSYPNNYLRITESYEDIRKIWQLQTSKMQCSEEELNRIFIEAYGLQVELTPELPLEEITLTCNPYYRYGDGKNEEELEAFLCADTMREFISYAVGCMFGRYSLNKPGLILANLGETLQDYLRQVIDPSFLPDEDNSIPILDSDWFSDDISERFKQFLRVTFGEEHFDENLAFIENAVGRDIRSYFLKEFYNDHVKMYKKRPIYWLFSSPKGSFNVLIYMHRYTKNTVSIVLNKYLREFHGKLELRKSYLEQISISASAEPREKTAALKEIQALDKKLEEIRVYERDILFPLAAQHIEIDLDDGVKVNYAKFGSALAKIPGL